MQGIIRSAKDNLSLNGILKKNFKSNKKYKEETGEKIMKALNITKEEYSSLSKRARMELFECLFAHKEKCGAECEHLKRAMMIKLKDKGQLYPMKKLTIVKG